jgi:DNA-binding PadR family transcriptional regulator
MKKSKFELQNLSRSCNEVVVLTFIEEGPKHGYQLAVDSDEKADGYFRFQHGTLYPILHKLEKQGLIKGVWSNEGPRGKRKSYRLTRKGRRFLDQQRDSWRDFIDHFLTVIGKEFL